MQELNKFTILIPTKNRCETLEWAIKSCLQTSYPYLTVIISDNCSTDNTSKMVSEFQDSRVKYFRTPQPLSMTANWEFALSKAEDGYVTILGDDDGFLPDSFERINALLHQYKLKAISWKQSFFRWPGNNYVRIPELLSVPIKTGIEIRQCSEMLPKVLQCEAFPGDLPWLYGGFVDISVIQSLKERGGGRFFYSKIPDIYSAMVLASELETYIFSFTPLSIAGHSAKSNGAAQIQNKPEFEAQKNLFNKESEDIPFHSDLEFVHVYPIIVWETYLQSLDAGMQNHKGLADGQKLLDLAISDAISLGFLEKEGKKLESIAYKNHLKFEIPQNKIKIGFKKIFLKMYHYYMEWTTSVFINISEYKIKNIYEASMKHNEIHQKYSSKFAVFVHNFVLLLKRAV